MGALVPAISLNFVRIRFEDRDRANASAEFGPFKSVRVTATEVRTIGWADGFRHRVGPLGDLLARRAGDAWQVKGDIGVEYVHVLVWDNNVELVTVEMPADEHEDLERMYEKYKGLVLGLSLADILRAGVRHAAELPPEEIFEAIQHIRKKDKESARLEGDRQGQRDGTAESSKMRGPSLPPSCGRCGMLLHPGSRSCIHCGADNGY